MLFFTTIINMSANELKYPFIYIPGMFDNGDLCREDYLLVKNLNHEDGFYYNSYFSDDYRYDLEPLVCGSNILGSKYNRLVVANLIGDYRTNISLELMADRLFCLMMGRAPKGRSFKGLTNHRGGDYRGSVVRDGRIIEFQGLLEELWAKYGRRVSYKEVGRGFRVVLEPGNRAGRSAYYENEAGYFGHPDEIKFNILAHSSGGLAIRRFIELCEREGLSVPVNLIINLSVPQKGARMNYTLKSAFPELIRDTMISFFEKAERGEGEVSLGKSGQSYSYAELVKKTRVEMMKGDSLKAKGMRKLVSNYILYFIPFDGRKRVLAGDPALWDLHPGHNFVKRLNKVTIPDEIKIYNYRVKTPYARMFVSISSYLGLGDSDGVVDYDDTGLELIPNYEQLIITDIDVAKANHIPFPYIKPVYELDETVAEFYPVLKVLLKEKVKSKEEGVKLVEALFTAIMHEFGLDLDYYLEHEDYSVIDYYAENPLEL